MTKDEILKKIDELELELFLLRMIDRWSSNEYREFNRLNNEIDELKKML